MPHRKEYRKDYVAITGAQAKERYGSLESYDFHQLVFPAFKSYLLKKSPANGLRKFNDFCREINLGDLDLDDHADRAYVLSEMCKSGFPLPDVVVAEQAS